MAQQGRDINAQLWLIPVVVKQKPTQHCKEIILQLKKKSREFIWGLKKCSLGDKDSGKIKSVLGRERVRGLCKQKAWGWTQTQGRKHLSLGGGCHQSPVFPPVILG